MVRIGGGNLGGTGSAGYVAKFIDSATLANSQIQDDGTNIAIGKTPVTGIKLDVAGNIRAQDDLAASTLTVGTVSKANVSSATVADASNQIPTDTLEIYHGGFVVSPGNCLRVGEPCQCRVFEAAATE